MPEEVFKKPEKNLHFRQALILVFLLMGVFLTFNYFFLFDNQDANVIKVDLVLPENLGETDKLFVWSKNEENNTSQLLISSNGFDWDTILNFPFLVEPFSSITKGNGVIHLFSTTVENREVEKKNQFFSSLDGEHWYENTEISLPVLNLEGYGIIFHNNNYYLLGGFSPKDNGYDFFDSVWVSPDLKNWKLIKENSPWGRRSIRSTFSFDGKIWIFGGVKKDKQASGFSFNNMSDVWISSDGIDWQEYSAGWNSYLGISGVFSIAGKVFVLVGDGFSSDISVFSLLGNGLWTQVLEKVPFENYNFSIINTSSFAYILGGSNSEMPSSQVWRTSDGVNWIFLGDIPAQIGEGAPSFGYNF